MCVELEMNGLLTSVGNVCRLRHWSSCSFNLPPLTLGGRSHPRGVGNSPRYHLSDVSYAGP